MSTQGEKDLQETFSWARQTNYTTYNAIMAYYQAMSILEHKRGNCLLDMPCGDGKITGILAKHFERVVGIDASKKHFDVAIKDLPYIKFHHALIEKFETDEKFDTITMINVIEHVVEPAAILKKAKSLLQDDGIIIVHAPNAHAVNRKIAEIMGTLKSCEELSPFDIHIAGHRRAYTMQSLSTEIEAAGLQIISRSGIFYKMLSTSQIDWLLNNGPWEEGGFGWGRVGEEHSKDWRAEFCRACYEFGKSCPEDCNVISICAVKK